MNTTIKLASGRAYFLCLFALLIAFLILYGMSVTGSLGAFFSLFERRGLFGLSFLLILIVFFPIIVIYGPFRIARAYIEGYVIKYDDNKICIFGNKTFLFSDIASIHNLKFPVIDYAVELNDGNRLNLNTYLTDVESAEVKNLLDAIKSKCELV